MLTTLEAWGCIGAILMTSACGGDVFVFAGDASPSPDGAPLDDGSVIRSDAPASNNTVLCPNGSCHSQICCTTASSQPNASCTSGACGCSTVLECANDTNCPGAMPFCCIGSRTDSACGTPHFVAQCKLGCLGTETRLCDPANPRCPPTKSCSMDSGDLQKWGLPQNIGYGVCI
jgi:hypothetical protein